MVFVLAPILALLLGTSAAYGQCADPARLRYVIVPANPAGNPPDIFRPAPGDVTFLGVPALPAPGGGAYSGAQAGAVLALAVRDAVACSAADGLEREIVLTVPADSFAYEFIRPFTEPPSPDEVAVQTGAPVIRPTSSLQNPKIRIVGEAVAIGGRVEIRRGTEAVGFEGLPWRFFAVDEDGRLEIENLRFVGGRVPGGGGAILVSGRFDSTSGQLLSDDIGLFARNCEFRTNTAGNRGGAISAANLQVAGDGSDSDPLTPGSQPVTAVELLDCVFEANDAGLFGGGGVYIERASARVRGSQFTNNVVGTRGPIVQRIGGAGGGLYYNSGAGASGGAPKFVDLGAFNLPATKNTFTNNQAWQGGGAYLNGITNKDPIDPAAGEVPGVAVFANFLSNDADDAGGGVFVNEGDHRFQFCNFGGDDSTTNTARQGGGAFARGFTGRFIRCNFVRNFAIPDARSGSIASGGGAFVDSKDEVISFEECCFTANEAANDGGGLKFRGTSAPVVDDCVFRDNVALFGGGIANGDAFEAGTGAGGPPNSLIYNTVLTRNVGMIAGGGVFITAQSQPTLLHCTISDNKSRRVAGTGPVATPAGPVDPKAGTGVHIHTRFAGVQVLNSIIWGNDRGSGGSTNGSFSFNFSPVTTTSREFPNVRFSIIDDTTFAPVFPTPPEDSAADVNCLGPSINSNINASPRFVNLVAGNVHLTCPSPAIDRASHLRGRRIIREFAFAGRIPGVSATSPTIEAEIDAYMDDYDDGPENPLGVEPCPAPNCTPPYCGNPLTDGYCNGDGVQPRTRRPAQCQADMGADESFSEIAITPLTDKVVCVNGRQTFTVTANCPSFSQCDSPTPTPVFSFRWCRVDPITCVETDITEDPAYTIVPSNGLGTTSTLTIPTARPIDNAYFKVKIERTFTQGRYVRLRQPGDLPGASAFPLPSCLSGDPIVGTTSCPPAMSQARLFVVPQPDVVAGPDRTVCRNGSQFLSYTFSWTELPPDGDITCPPPPPGEPFPKTVFPIACTPTISYTYQRIPTAQGGSPVTFTGNARATIVCEPDTFVPDPVVAGARRVTRECRIVFTDALDGTGSPTECDAGEYCARISCGLPEPGKCIEDRDCANLCVIPTPIPGGDQKNVVCTTGNQTINLNGTFPLPSACALPWCPTNPCTPVVMISRLRSAPGSMEEQLFTFPNAQNLTSVTLGNTVVTCTPLNTTTRRINCTVTVNNATPADCARYRITTDCSNLVPDDKCRAAFWDSVLCVLPPINGVGDPIKNVCLGGTQTACLYLEYPTPDCIYCLPPFYDAVNPPCTPTFPPVVRRVAPNGTTVTIPMAAIPGDPQGRFRGTRTDAPPVAGQATSTTTVTCEPFNATTRRINCCVEVRNANDANCARYRIEGNCSNLPATDKCQGAAETAICVARPPTVTTAPDQFVCIDGTQSFPLSANFPTQPCIHCGPLAPRAMVLFRPTGGAEQMFPCVAQPDGTCTGTIGNATVVCQPYNTTTRAINCVVTITGAAYSECGEYCIKADYVGVDSDKCPPVTGCTRVCIVPKPIASGDPDKTVCFGKSQVLNFKATFPRGLCQVSTACPTACTPAASMFKRDAAGNVTPLITGGGTTVTCQPVATLPNGDREINCTVNVTNADSADCLEYIIRASCANLNTTKCQTAEWATKLCVIRNPVVTIDSQRYVCVGGNQTINATVNFPAQDCFYCPTNACMGTFEFVRRPNTSCTSPSTGGAVLPVVPSGQTPPATGPYVTCTPSPDGRTQNCTIFIRNAMDAGSASPDCGAYYVRAKSCPNLPTDKCDYVEACGQLCVIPAPDATGDSNKCVCIGGNQTFNFRGFFPTPSCAACPTSPAACTPFVTLVRKLPGGGEQVLYVSSGTQPGPQPRITATCSPLSSVTGGREFRCTVTINAAEAADCAEYCLRASCSNLDTGKCATDEWCANLCVLPNPRTGGDTSKTVCVKGTQYIDLYAEFPEGDCGYCTLPGANCCTPAWVIKRRSPSGSEITLNIGGSRTDSQTYPSLPGPPDGAETVVATTTVACEPIGPGPTRRVNCRVTITNANDANCGEYCIEANCSNYPATGAGSDKCRTSRYCARLCVLRPPSVTTPAEVCVCVGGCQTIPFTVNFPAPTCNVTGCDATTCQRVINVYKLDPNGNRICALTAGAGVDQFVCDPPVNGVQNCRIRVGGGNCGTPGTGCPGASLSEDNNQYCVEVTCGDLAEGKCLTDRSCTRLRVYEPPCPTAIDDIKICQRNEVCVDFNFVAPPCCQSAIVITKDGNPVTLSTSGRYRLITLPDGGRRFCITAPSGQLLDNTDDGVYRVTISCPNLTAEKNCSCYEEFCLDILPPPAVTVLPPVQTVCEGQDADFYICPTGDLMYCPVPGAPPGPMPVPLTVMVEKVSARPTGDNCQLPTGETAEPVWTNVTVTPDPTTACPTRYRVHFEDVVDENCGFYRVKVTYAVTGSGFDPDQRCVTCTYFELRCGTVNVCLKITPVCEDEPLKICPRFAACDPDPYQIPGGVNCADYPCFDFKWYFTPSNPPGPERELVGETSCCLMFAAAGPQHEGCYRLVVTPNNTRPGCESQPPCDPVTVTDCFYLRPPEECCWCVDCCWDNGRRDNGPNADGVLSMKPAHSEFPEIKAAADFALCEGQFHRIKKFAGSMLIRQNPTLPYKAKLTLYEDCDGCPGDMIGMWDLVEYCLVETPDSTGLQKIDFVREFTEEDKLWLRGGKTYWWSLQGVSDAVTVNYEAYWVTSELGHIVGSVPKKMEAGIDASWIPLGDCCIDCTELAFCIECDSCKIIYDGGTPEPCATAGGSRSEKSSSPTRNSRAADNFVTPPVIKKTDPGRPECEFMSVDWMVCYVEAYIYTNCNPLTFRAYLEIYGNNCDDPNWTLIGDPPYRFRADKIDPVEPECLATIDGVSNLRLYKVRFCPMGSPTYPMGLYLRGGRNYWASVSVEDGFAQNQRAYFAWNSDDCDPCPIQFGPGKEIAPGARNIIRWTGVGHDFAFLIAAKNVPFDTTVPNVPVTDGNNCLPDTNGDGNVTVQDMFDFLNAWFAGCP